MRIPVIISLLLLSLVSVAQYSYTPGCIRAHEAVTSLRFSEAAVIIEQERNADPDNLVPLMLESYRDFITLMVGEDENDYERLSEKRGEALDRLSEGDPASPWYLHALARENLQWAFARVKFGSYLNAALDIRRAYFMLLENQEKHPGFLPDKLGLGVLHALIGGIPDNYQWIAGIFSMRGSVELGRTELLEVLENAEEEGFPFLKEEALFYVSFLDLNLQSSPLYASTLQQHFSGIPSDNLLLIFPRARILMQTGRNEEALALLVSRPAGNEYYPFYYLEYLEGLCRLNRLDSRAAKNFTRFTANFRGKSYIKSAYQRIAWSSLLEGDTSAYFSSMEKVKEYGSDLIDGDMVALDDARSGEIPNTCLLRARLLFDGGYYLMADSILQLKDCPLDSERDRIEHPYRRGRVYHSLGRLEEALSWYARAIVEGEESPYYFAANAALQMGNIYESEGRNDEAEEMYRKCIRMPNREYETSLKQKARAGLNRLREDRKP